MGFLLRLYISNNASTSDNWRDDTLHGIRVICADIRHFWARLALFLLLTAVLAACDAAVDEIPVAEEIPVAADATPLPAAPAGSSDCGEDGFFQTELFGALAGRIEWDANTLICEGMPRPDGDGARLRFAGTVAGEYELAFIIALPDLRPGVAGKELHSKVTIIEEGAGRFFSNADKDICWTDILDLEALPGSDSQYSVSGSLYCVAPLVEVRGETDITLGDLTFRGLLDWESS